MYPVYTRPMSLMSANELMRVRGRLLHRRHVASVAPRGPSPQPVRQPPAVVRASPLAQSAAAASAAPRQTPRTAAAPTAITGHDTVLTRRYGQTAWDMPQGGRSTAEQITARCLLAAARIVAVRQAAAGGCDADSAVAFPSPAWPSLQSRSHVRACWTQRRAAASPP